MTQDDRMETITGPAAIRETDEPDERTTPAPVGAAVALDLDAMARRYSTATDDEVIYEMYPALEAEVVRLTERADHKSALAADNARRAEAAEAEVRTLRARLAAVEALRPKLLAELRFIWTAIDGRQYREAHEVIDYVEQWFLAEDRAALAVTTGEGQHVAREVFTADGIPFVRCSCTNAKSPTSSRWLTEHVPNGGVAELQAVVKRQADQA